MILLIDVLAESCQISVNDVFIILLAPGSSVSNVKEELGQEAGCLKNCNAWLCLLYLLSRRTQLNHDTHLPHHQHHHLAQESDPVSEDSIYFGGLQGSRI